MVFFYGQERLNIMLNMFKKHYKDMLLGGIAGGTIGAAAGAAAGRVGLDQACNVEYISRECTYILDNASSSATQVGSAVGMAVGFGIGAIAYPVYKGFMGWCYGPRQKTQAVQLSQLSDAPVIDVKEGSKPGLTD
jgi:hypothetical protein